MKLNLYTTYFKSDSTSRQQELDYCLMQNLQNLYINKIHVFLDARTRSSDFYHFFEDTANHVFANKLNFIKIDRVPTYKDWIEYSLQNNGISIFANADIYFDESINKTYQYLEQKDSIICLSRYEDCVEYISPHNNPHWSQDTWIINFDQNHHLNFIDKLNIPTGKYRCDNKIAYVFSVNGWQLYNPFSEIKSYHRHHSNLRTYDQADTSIIGSLAFVYPTESPSQPSKVEYHIMPVKTANIKKEVVVGQWLEAQIRYKHKPTITVPICGPEDKYYYRQKTAFYQMISAWQERGYVDLEFSNEAEHYWWNGKNNILLFDRDLVIELYDRKKDPPRWEGLLKYKFGFFGNEYNLPNNINHKMTYWSFSPKDLEQHRQNIGRKSYTEREFHSVFIGSIENETQEYFRHLHQGWESAIDLYSCIDKLDDKHQKNKYTFEQYLHKISSAKFGICFRGGGPKCYREIEYLSMGTPLIITPGVEVNYPDPLIEGTHYFLANNPQDIKRIVDNTTQKQWTEMSIACWEWFEKNATIDSMFRYLNSEISKLQNRPIHTRLSINCKHNSTNSIAYKSAKIFNPDIDIIFNEPNTLSIDADNIVVNQITNLGSESEYVWKIKPTELETYIKSVQNSGLTQHKDLMIALGLRFDNYKVTKLRNDNETLDINIKDNKLLLCEGEVAEIQSDFDFSRRCGVKYKHINKRLVGPTEFTVPKISAKLLYLKHDQALEYDMSKYFNDYYTIYNTVISEELVYNICKLWEFEDCQLDKIIGSIDDVTFEYSQLKYRINEPIDFLII